MISHLDRKTAERLAGVVQDVVDLSREPGIRIHVVGQLFVRMTAADVAEAVCEHGDQAAVILAIERLCPGSIDDAQAIRSRETARA